MTHPAGDGGKLGLHYFPLPDALTMEEYHRLDPDAPAPLRPPEPPTPTLICPACGDPFAPRRFAGRPRFCSPACRRRFHGRLQTARRKAVA